MFEISRTFSVRRSSRSHNRHSSVDQEEADPPETGTEDENPNLPHADMEGEDPEAFQMNGEETELEIAQIKQEEGERQFGDVKTEDEDSGSTPVKQEVELFTCVDKQEVELFTCEDRTSLALRQETDDFLHMTQEVADHKAVHLGPLEARKTTRKRNFTDTEIEVLVEEVDARKIVLFGGHSNGVTNKRKTSEWKHVLAAVNSVSATERSVAEVKKKWSDLKVEAKRRVTWHPQHELAAGRGQNVATPTLLDTKIASIIGAASVCDVVSEQEGDTDLAETVTVESEGGRGHQLPATSCPGTMASGPAAPGTSAPITLNTGRLSTSALTASVSKPPGAPGSGRVLTSAVLQTQRDTIRAINEVRDELQQMRAVMTDICGVLCDIAGSIKDAVKK